jgi:hypothetical protein
LHTLEQAYGVEERRSRKMYGKKAGERDWMLEQITYRDAGADYIPRCWSRLHNEMLEHIT